MKYLLDTCILLWVLEDNKDRLGNMVELIEDSNNIIAISVINYWEISIKKTLEKIKIPDNWMGSVDEIGLHCFNLERKHLFQLEKLPLHHNDPFDRLLISQAIAEQFKLLTVDQKILQYDF